MLQLNHVQFQHGNESIVTEKISDPLAVKPVDEIVDGNLYVAVEWCSNSMLQTKLERDRVLGRSQTQP